MRDLAKTTKNLFTSRMADFSFRLERNLHVNIQFTFLLLYFQYNKFLAFSKTLHHATFVLLKSNN